MSTFPQSFKSSVSHWQATNRGTNSLWSLNKEAPLSKDEQNADIVIVGAGMTGSALAYFLTRPGGEGEGKRVVVVEAKDVGSGATGRNGGHVGPATFEDWEMLQRMPPHGAGISRAEATRVIQFERDNLELIARIVEKEGITEEVDFWKGMLCETHETAKDSEEAKRLFNDWLNAREEIGLSADSHNTTFIYDVEEAKKVSRFKKLYSAYLRPAGSVHSHKLCTALLRLALASSPSLTFHSWTPVHSIKQLSTSEKGGWMVQTAKGCIKTKKVILATNAHTKNFFDKEDDMHHHIVPTLAQCSLITPPPTFSSASSLNHTMNMKDGMYLVQTPSGGIVLGGGFELLVSRGLCTPSQREGVTDDSSVIPAWEKLLADYCEEHFEGWGEEALGEGLTRCWTGILTHVKDCLPVVGEVMGKKGLWVAAGFHGHGMSRIFSVTSALAEFLKDDTYDEALLPIAFKLTKERLVRARDVNVVDVYTKEGESLKDDKRGKSADGDKVTTQPSGWGCVVA